MLGVGQGFSYNHALFWCHWLPMNENYFLKWSLDMTSTSLEHKTRIAQAETRMEKKSLSYAKIGNYQLVNNIIYHEQVGQISKKYFNLEIDRYLSLGPSWMTISGYLGGIFSIKHTIFAVHHPSFQCFTQVTTIQHYERGQFMISMMTSMSFLRIPMTSTCVIKIKMGTCHGSV